MLPEPDQAQVYEWLGGKPQREVRALVKEAYGFAPSSAALSGFYSWWTMRQQLVRNESTLAGLLESLEEKQPGMSAQQLETVGQAFFTALAVEQQDPKAWVATQRLMVDRERLALERKRFARETCELFLKWSTDRRAQEIAESNAATQSEKIQKLGRLMFGEDW